MTNSPSLRPIVAEIVGEPTNMASSDPDGKTVYLFQYPKTDKLLSLLASIVPEKTKNLTKDYNAGKFDWVDLMAYKAQNDIIDLINERIGK